MPFTAVGGFPQADQEKRPHTLSAAASSLIPADIPGDPYHKKNTSKNDGHGLPDKKMSKAKSTAVVPHHIIKADDAKDVYGIHEANAIKQPSDLVLDGNVHRTDGRYNEQYSPHPFADSNDAEGNVT